MKHFTDAELAAEYWGLDADGVSLNELTDRETTVYRFATHPHALEDS